MTSMMILRTKVLHVIALLGLPAMGFSQWVRYPTAGVPRKADGTPNLAAPPARLPGGKPGQSYRNIRARLASRTAIRV